jgi:hypothetical protein
MIALPPNARVWLAAGTTDMRKYALITVMRSTWRRARICAGTGPLNAVHNEATLEWI